MSTPVPNNSKIPSASGEHYSTQAESIKTHVDEYNNEIPSGTSGPKYDANKAYASTGDSTHSDCG